MIPQFARSVPELSMIYNNVLSFIHENFGHKLNDMNQVWLAPNKGAPLQNCWGFIDGTVRPICRPGENQRQVYNGHKRVHALKFHLNYRIFFASIHLVLLFFL